MAISLGMIMDPIADISLHKDSSFAMLLAAQSRDWPLYYMEQNDLFLRDGVVYAEMRSLSVEDNPAGWFQLGPSQVRPLSELDVVLNRKDPPFNMEYIYTTYLLDLAESAGVRVVNQPGSVRAANEKLFAAWFAPCCPPTLVSADKKRIREFREEQGDIIIKPLDGMGGSSVFRVDAGDPNFSVIVETLTDHGQQRVMSQRYLPAIKDGDKRILMIDGEPVPYALARIPADGETRGNIAAGGRTEGRPLTDRDHWICKQVGPTLREKGLLFVGLDVIGDYLTEINVTSPTCIRELDRAFDLDIGGQLMDTIQTKFFS